MRKTHVYVSEQVEATRSTRGERQRVRKPVLSVAYLAAWMDRKSATKDKKEWPKIVMDMCERKKVIGTTRAGERNGQERE